MRMWIILLAAAAVVGLGSCRTASQYDGPKASDGPGSEGPGFHQWWNYADQVQDGRCPEDSSGDRPNRPSGR